jgi:type IV pilus assembly protein PilF
MKTSWRGAALCLAGMALAACVTNGDEERSESPKDAAAYNAQLGIGYLQMGDVKTAREKIERALKQDPGNANVHTAAALLYDRMGDIDKADSHYSTVVRMNPRDPEALNNRAVFLCRNKRAAAGEKIFLEAAASPLNRAPEMAFYNAGLCARDSGRLEEAQRHLDAALNAKPSYRDAIMELAELHLAGQRPNDARNYLMRAFDSGPTTADTLWLGVRIETAAGNARSTEIYKRRLKTEFPDAEQTRALIASERKPSERSSR